MPRLDPSNHVPLSGFKYIVEHMEPSLDKWSELEYLNVAKHVGPNRLYLTSLHADLLVNLPPTIADPNSGIVYTEKSVLEIPGLKKERCILLDPASKEELKTGDREEFEWLVFGGILGDDPPQDRTRFLRQLGFPTRHLGPIQMTTDTACLVTQQVIEKQIPLNDLPYTDHPEIRFNKKECVQMPFRYLRNDDGEPKLPEGMRDLLRSGGDDVFDLA
ncbi:SAM-dependent RNA methyltransferase [Gaertneriomyces semiglobifer]|nr:SAM-dependent RNA methyltransferase [Gaertneriomyces semiglobifer]